MFRRSFFTTLIVYILLVMAGNAYPQDAQPVKYWIIFEDKGKFKPDMEITPGSEAYETGKALLSEKAIKRRLKVLPPEKLIDFADLPLNETYVNDVKNAGIEIIAKSRWLNGVSAYLNKKQLEKVEEMDFVGQLKLVKQMIKQSVDENDDNKDKEESLIENTNVFFFDRLDSIGKNRVNYGRSLRQNEAINVIDVHNMNITGKGIMVASFDDGFDWKNHESLRDLNITAEYDFINKDNNTAPEKNQKHYDGPSQGSHGTATLSTMAAYMPGKMIGPAFGSEFILAKTEYDPTETPMEEDFWLEAAEWAEQKGVDIITSSLMYKDFYDDDNHPNSYKYTDYNGNTAITTIAADRCVYLGIAVFNSVGNYYQTGIPSLGSPSDGDSVISIGASTLDGDVASFSSNGPTGDGQIKPDLVAPGLDVLAAQIMSESGNDKTYETTSGTSFSCPITAGVGALILSAHPELTPMQLRDALRNTANNSRNPNNIVGWGNVNAYDALLYFGPAWSNSPEYAISESGGMEVSIYLASKDLIEPNSVKMFYETGDGQFREVQMQMTGPFSDGNNSGRYSAVIDATTGTPLKMYFSAKDFSGKTTTYPKKAPEEFIVK